VLRIYLKNGRVNSSLLRSNTPPSRPALVVALACFRMREQENI
jgi:hypothetical protein